MARALGKFSFENLSFEGMVAWWIGPRDAARRGGPATVAQLDSLPAGEVMVAESLKDPTFEVGNNFLPIEAIGLNGWAGAIQGRPGLAYLG